MNSCYSLWLRAKFRAHHPDGQCGKTARPIPNRGLHEVLLPVTDCSWPATIAARVHFFCQPELRGQLMAERYID